MKKTIGFLSAVLVFTNIAFAQTFTLKSKDLGGQATSKQFLNAMGCTGENSSPQLSWENAPAGTQAFAVTMYDRDAPTGSGLWHWVVFNIPSTVNELKTGAGDVSKLVAPKECVQSNNDFGKPGYLGVCPPPGQRHEYLITVYALKTKLELPATTSPAVVGFYLGQATLGKASLVIYAQQ